MIFLRFSIEFTSLLRNFSNKNRYCIGVLRFCREDPKKNWGLAVGPLAGKQGRGGLCRADSGEGEARRRRGRGGEARGGRALPRGGLGRGWGGRRGVVAGAVEVAAAVSSDSGAPAADLGWARAGEVHRREEELAGGSFGAVEDRRGELHGSRATAAIGCRGGSSPVAWGGGERAWEDQREATERFPGSAWAEGYRRWWLRWSRGGGDYGGLRRGETARRARRQRAEGEGVRVANEKASSRGFGNGRRGSRR